jgi:MFS family permease
VLLAVVFTASLGGIVLIFSVFLQEGLGFTPWHSALTTAPWAAGAFVGSAVAGMIMARLGRRIVHAGLVVETVGLVSVCLVLRGLGPQISTLDLLAPMIIGGIGMAMVFVLLFGTILADVPLPVIGSASGALQTINSLGMALRRGRPGRGVLQRCAVDRGALRRAAGRLVRGGLLDARRARDEVEIPMAPAAASADELAVTR